MKYLLNYIIGLFLASSCIGILLSCQSWDLPGRKSQRDCVKPSGTLNTQMQQLKVDFSISNNAGTVDQVVWDFGNGSTTITTGMTVSYTYPAAGSYNVKATLANTCLQETSLLQTISVSKAVPPTVSLQQAADLTTTAATLRMTLTSTGNAPITRYGVCFSSTNTNPTITDDFVLDKQEALAIGTPVSFSATNLQPNTLYYVRGFAVNSAGTGYSTPVQLFQTNQDAVVTISSVTVGITTADAQVSVTTLGNPAITAYGICFASNTTNPDLTNAPSVAVSAPAIGSTLINIKNLMPNTKYYYRLFIKDSTNPDHFTYGNVSTFTTQADPVLQDLVAAISFTEQSLQDASGYNNNVKLAGSPTFTTDRKGKADAAILLDGTKDYFYMDDNSSLNPDALSISIWIRPGILTGRMQIYNKSRFSDGTAEMYSALMKLEKDIGPNITISTDIKQNSNCESGKGWQTFAVTNGIPLNVWHHLVFTYSGQSVRMYFDGALQYAPDNLPATVMDKCPGGELKFGAAIQGLNWYFKGAMDDIRIYKRALSAGEVQTLFNQ